MSEAKRDAVGLGSGMNTANILAAIASNPIATRCTDALVRGQWDQDISAVITPEAHFDNCLIDLSVDYLRQELKRADAHATSGRVWDALTALGRVAHSLQDFYAHTNYVEISADAFADRSAVPAVALWSPSSDAALADLRHKGLVSGTVVYERGEQCPVDPQKHAKLTHDDDLAKDDLKWPEGKKIVPAWNITHYRAAYLFARDASAELIQGRLKSPEWDSVVRQCGLNYGYGLTFDQRR
jgi:hypothetical protein